MIRVFYGDDRVSALEQVRRILGHEYESLEGSEMTAKDLPEIFYGATLFDAGSRRILIKDLGLSKEAFLEVPKYADTKHEVILLEQKFDKRTAAGKEMAKTLEVKEFKIEQKVDRNLAFNIFDTARRDGARAVKLLNEALAQGQDPYLMVGAWSWKAIRNFQDARPGRELEKEKRVLKELSKLDVDMKTSAISSQPELLLSSFLLRVSSL